MEYTKPFLTFEEQADLLMKDRGMVADRVEPTRFKRFYGESDVPFVGISELFDVNAQPTKHVYPKLIKGYQQFMLEPGTLVMAR